MPQVYTYTSKVSNITYTLNTSATHFWGAQQSCNDNGGHLVSWRSLLENQEVEVRGRLWCCGAASCQLRDEHALLAASAG